MEKKIIRIASPLAVILFLLPAIILADENKSLVSVSGTYGTAIGFTTDKFLWKDANADYQEKNFRYVFSDTDVNTYDKRIFDRYECEIKTDTHTPWNVYTDIKIDPWAFTAIGHETVVSSSGDRVNVNYKYWENTGKVVNQTWRTYQGNAVSYSELKVVGNTIRQETDNPYLWSAPSFTFSKGNTTQLDHFFRPVRKAWIEYKEEPLEVKVFPIADQAEALTTDDPLRLSNNHVNYAPSPWTFEFVPGQQLNTGVTRAGWNWDLAWYAEDSNRNYLTYLRGASVHYALGDKASIDSTIASPMSPWDYYETVNSMPWATRFKFHPTDKLMVGSTVTSKLGIYKQELRAANYVLGFDFNYNIAPDTDFFGEYAASYMHTQEINRQNVLNTDGAFKIGIKAKVDLPARGKFNWEINFTNMGPKFSPGLSDYRDTREDQDWGRHIWFDDIPKDSEWYRIGDGIDVGRYVVGVKARTLLYDDMLDIYFTMHNAHNSYSDKFVENVARLEVTYSPIEHLQVKGLALDRAYPHALGGWDPILRDRYTDQFWRNYQVQDGKDVNMMTFGGGAKVDCCDERVVIYGVYESTNDPQNFPRNVLNNYAYNSTSIENNVLYNDLITQVYQQGLIGLPDYHFYNLWKGCVVVKPVDKIAFKFTHVTNSNRYYAALIDNNQNQDTIEMTVTPYERATFKVGYSISRIIDLARASDTNGIDRQFNAHHNVYAQFRLNLKNESKLTVQFGEAWIPETGNSVYGTNYVDNNVSVLDTQAIIRIFYEGKF